MHHTCWYLKTVFFFYTEKMNRKCEKSDQRILSHASTNYLCLYTQFNKFNKNLLVERVK